MPKITTADITALGFTAAMFALDDTDWTTMATDMIAEQAALLEGRIGSTSYAATSNPAAAYTKRAEKCLVAAELLQRRFVILSQEVQTANGLDAFKIRRTRQEYIDEANALIERIVNGQASDSSGYSGGVATSSHFADTTTLGGLEVAGA